MAVNWNAPGPQNNALSYFQLGAQMGDRLRVRKEQREDRQREQEGRNALAAYATNPNDEGFAAAVQYDPRSAFAVRADVRQSQADERTQMQQRMKQVSRLFQGVTPENYGQRVAIASEMGLDVSGVPQQYDPAWVERQGQIFNFMAERPEAASNAGKQAMDMGYQPGTPQFNEVVQKIIEAGLAQPYMGSGGETRLYTPQLGNFGGPQPGAVEDGYRFKGGNPADPNSWEPVQPTIQNTPAPQLGANGFPSTLTRQQYQAVVNAKGQAATDEWMRRNNIQIGGN